ncbi:putative ammonium transporter 1 isoform X2 [Planococcus citri]
MCIESSRVRDKYTSDVFLKVFLHLVVSCSMYWLIGWRLSFSDGNFFTGYISSRNSTTAEYSYSDSDSYQSPANTMQSAPLQPSAQSQSQSLYTALVIATPVTLISAVLLERCNAITFLIYSVLISGVIHPICIHWTWTAQGWLRNLGYVDFSGAGVVFAFAGASCFIVSVMMGPRQGRFNENSEISPIYSTSLFGTGVMLSVVGLISFNCGALHRTSTSTSMDGAQDSGDGDGDGASVSVDSLNKIIQNTIVGGAGGCLVALAIGRMRIQQSLWLLSNTANGCFSAMVAVSAAAFAYSALESFTIGMISAVIFTALRYFILLLKIDDPIDACPVYFGGGVWGMVAMKIFSRDGMLHSENPSNDLWSLLINFAGVTAICLWSAIWTIITTLLVKGVQKFAQKEEPEAPDTSNLYQEDSCYIEALPMPMPVPMAYPVANVTNVNDAMKSSDRDEYISRLKSNTRKILNTDFHPYENLALDMELQIRR